MDCPDRLNITRYHLINRLEMAGASSCTIEVMQYSVKVATLCHQGRQMLRHAAKGHAIKLVH
ncbi:MAG: hypothetical protein M0Q91_03160 [Methanoregula sp.]|jgi:hypothetical protein|nr:hypothetical protein [Methanoregula sp.]